MTARPWRIGWLLVWAACSSSLGSTGEDIPPEGVTVQVPCADPEDPRPQQSCPDLPTVPLQTARNLVETLRPLARSIEGAGTRWTGRLQGVKISVKGLPVVGQGASGWVTAFCQGGDALWFDVTGENCGLRRLCDCASAGTCGGAACDGDSEPALPQVDSDRAIRAAFPADPAGETYDLDYDSRMGHWQVTRFRDRQVVKVDGSTGAVLP